jgi:endoglucanase
VMFDLYNEPRDISWSCWQHGCQTAEGWQTASMQSLIDGVRATGATQPIIATGLNHGNDLSGWLSHRLHDPLRQLVAGVHVYNQESDGYCNSVACWNRTLIPVAKKVPIVTGELGEHDRRSTFITKYMKWADRQWRLRRPVSILAWSWDAAQGEGGPSLITSFDGTPTTYGRGFETYLERLFERGWIQQL